MSKLLILDKDGTLVKPKSGGTFVQHPEDQELLPGVANAIAHYANEGWTMAIASNQGGCMVRECAAKNVEPGRSIQHPLSPAKTLKVIDIIRRRTPDYQGNSVEIVTDGNSLLFPLKRTVRVAWKTLDDAIAEMRYAMQLIYPMLSYPQNLNFRGLLCPDDGDTAWCVSAFSQQGDWLQSECDHQFGIRHGYRKPDPGMLIEIASWLRWSGYSDLEHVLMVGDRPEDEQAAISAGISFQWADDWRRSFDY